MATQSSPLPPLRMSLGCEGEVTKAQCLRLQQALREAACLAEALLWQVTVVVLFSPEREYTPAISLCLTNKGYSPLRENQNKTHTTTKPKNKTDKMYVTAQPKNYQLLVSQQK